MMEQEKGADEQDASPYYRIEQVAARTGLTKRTLRYYEEIGLLDPPARTEGNYRLYTTADIARLERIATLKGVLGLTLAEINVMIQAEDERVLLRIAYEQASDPAERLEQVARAEEITRSQLALVERKLQALSELHAALDTRLQRYTRARRDLP